VGRDKEAFGVYIHWPFCAQKCPYCDFNSHVRHQGWDEDRFLAAYKRELDTVAGMVGSAPSPRSCTQRGEGWGEGRQQAPAQAAAPHPNPLPMPRAEAWGEGMPRTVTSIFFGGGTPSLMKPETTAAILDHIAKLWSVDPKAEITLEANPGSVEATRFEGYRAAGINRVSMGFQSLRDDDLKRLGRIHTVDESKAALKIARETFERFSFDLIYARPGQQADAWRTELAEALNLAGDHISLYQLTIEPDTPYAALHAAGKLIVPDQDAALALYEITQEMTAARGLLPYEISNHARPGEESQHNLLYWRYGEYAGVGPGAHGRLVVGDTRLATVAEKNPEAWAALVEANGHGFTEITDISRSEQADEMLLMGLRLREGIDLDRLAALGGVRPSTDSLAHLQRLGMIELAQGRSFAPDISTKHQAGNWRTNELDAITMCVGPGLGPERSGSKGLGHNTPPSLIRATPKGRFVLNAVVAELSKNFVAAADTNAGDIDNADAAQ
jgi:putative oxygen-independent coproporphyrinogen III oxidase